MNLGLLLKGGVFIYIAHTREDGTEQSLKYHLENVAKLASDFSDAFGCGDVAYQMGLAHDIGKYSKEFQQRIRGEYKKPVDHSTAGGQALNKLMGPVPAYGVMGHHSGLMNGGSKTVSSGEDGSASLYARIKKDVPKYDGYLGEISFTACSPPALQPSKDIGLCISVLIRMLYSALVDADFLDTEAFMTDSAVQRGGYDGIQTLYDRFMTFIKKFDKPATEIHKKRNEILGECLDKAAGQRGLFSLTVPTGGGKTISSLGFALKHAKQNNLDRVIYVIPYTSIIEQNAQVIGDIVGHDNVLQHHSSISYDASEDGQDTKHLSTENWDAPVIVTTNVQFFESLFACRSSKCRKLHNIANSVIIFDEAQMLPLSYLIPCVKTIAELVKNYRVTAVLCTATQPALDPFFPPGLRLREICGDPQGLYEFFRRCVIKPVGELQDEELAERLNAEAQVLCIVNSRAHAQALYEKVDGGYHLSTLMTPMHRKDIIQKIRKALNDKHPCRVVSTSLIEAGVDLDFPMVYRAKNGLDSVIQAAGRCNREGKRPAGESFVNVFEAENKYPLPRMFRQPAAGFDIVSEEYGDIGSVEAIHRYFSWLYNIKNDDLDMLGIVERLNEGWLKGAGSLPFRDIAEEMRLIDQNTYPVFIPVDRDARALEKRILAGERSRALLRAMGQYSVNVYENHLNLLLQNGQVEFMDREVSQCSKDGIFILRDMDAYDEKLGLKVTPETGIGKYV